MTESLMKVSDLNFSYKKDKVLENVNFEINRGDYLALVGPNGGGKSTLIKILLGILKPNKGKIWMTPGIKLGYVPQRINNIDLNYPITIEEVVESSLGNRQSDNEAIEEALKITKLNQVKKKLIRELSGGQRQRVYIARALAGKPDALILDEPTVGVDEAAQDDFYKFLKVLNKAHGITIIFATHDIDVITGEANHIMCINKTLVCHTKTESFNKKTYLNSIYGKNIKVIEHHHG